MVWLSRVDLGEGVQDIDGGANFGRGRALVWDSGVGRGKQMRDRRVIEQHLPPA